MLADKYVCMYLVNVITTRPLHEYEHQFAICESCFWCATIFHKPAIKQEEEEYVNDSSNNDNLTQVCPTCKNKSISLIPLAKDEIYAISMEGKRGL
jgi:MinD superfamily P-loop ATPase